MTVNVIKRSTLKKVALLLHQLLVCTSPKNSLAEIQAKGVHLVYLTLHVGLGTFRPVSVDNLDEHEMHSEFCNGSSCTLRSVTLAWADVSSLFGTSLLSALETIGSKV